MSLCSTAACGVGGRGGRGGAHPAAPPGPAVAGLGLGASEALPSSPSEKLSTERGEKSRGGCLLPCGRWTLGRGADGVGPAEGGVPVLPPLAACRGDGRAGPCLLFLSWNSSELPSRYIEGAPGSRPTASPLPLDARLAAGDAACGSSATAPCCRRRCCRSSKPLSLPVLLTRGTSNALTGTGRSEGARKTRTPWAPSKDLRFPLPAPDEGFAEKRALRGPLPVLLSGFAGSASLRDWAAGRASSRDGRVAGSPGLALGATIGVDTSAASRSLGHGSGHGAPSLAAKRRNCLSKGKKGPTPDDQAETQEPDLCNMAPLLLQTWHLYCCRENRTM